MNPGAVLLGGEETLAIDSETAVHGIALHNDPGPLSIRAPAIGQAADGMPLPVMTQVNVAVLPPAT